MKGNDGLKVGDDAYGGAGKMQTIVGRVVEVDKEVENGRNLAGCVV